MGRERKGEKGVFNNFRCVGRCFWKEKVLGIILFFLWTIEYKDVLKKYFYYVFN